MQQFLHEHRVVPIPVGFSPTRSAIERLNVFDFLILGGGGLYNLAPPAPFESFDQWQNHLTTPIGVLGLGVEQLEPIYLPATHALINKAEFFIVRDEESKRVLNHDKVEITPDLTFFRPLHAINKNSSTNVVCGVNLRFINQEAGEWARAIQQLPCEKRALPFSSHPYFDDPEALSEFTQTPAIDLSLETYSQLDLMIGAAFHSIVFAIQSGLPTIAINYHSKVSRLMKELELENYLLEPNQWQKLPELYDQVLKNREKIHQQMLAYTTQANKTLTRVLESVEQRITGTHPKQNFSPSEPINRVSILVSCFNHTEEETIKSINSCLTQTYQNVEVIVFGNLSVIQTFKKSFESEPRVLWLDGQQLESVVDIASGTYVMQLEAGSWLSDDAISTLVIAIEKTTHALLAYTDYYLVNEQVNQHKIETHKHRIQGVWLSLPSPCTLIKRDLARDLLRQGKIIQKRHKLDAMHIPHGLLFCPASSTQLLISQSAIAYGRFQVENAQKLLSSAINQDSNLLKARRFEIEAIFEEVAYSPIVKIDPEQYLVFAFDHLPPAAKSLSSLRKRALSRAIMSRFYRSYKEREWKTALVLLESGIRNDASWMKNKGVWKMYLKALWHMTQETLFHVQKI